MNKEMTILIVEDEKTIAQTIEFSLKREGFCCLAVETAAEALALVQRTAVQLVVLDVGLPDFDGFECYRRLKLLKPDIPVVFLTARSDEIDRIVGLELGADDYICKPFSPRELAIRVRNILKRFTSPQNEKQTTCSDEPEKSVCSFIINDSSKTIHCNDTELKLRRYEYEMLVLLLRSPRRIFSRRQLMNRIWEEPESSMERTVDTHIKNIRSKLQRHGVGSEVVITHRGYGYSAAACRVQVEEDKL